LNGGGNALPGSAKVERANGNVETLSPCARVALEPGDIIIIETPGGGGYGTEP
jgi:5-oxoprolinase (ATP-hydrolysing)